LGKHFHLSPHTDKNRMKIWRKKRNLSLKFSIYSYTLSLITRENHFGTLDKKCSNYLKGRVFLNMHSLTEIMRKISPNEIFFSKWADFSPIFTNIFSFGDYLEKQSVFLSKFSYDFCQCSCIGFDTLTKNK